MPDYRNSPGFLYLEGTKFDRKGLFDRVRENISSCEPFKVYSNAESIRLPEPHFPPADIWHSLSKRRSVRRYSSKPLSLEELSCLMFAAQGITARMGRYLLRTAPSAGALYPIETYLCVNRCSSIESGLYHFNVASCSLELLANGRFEEHLAHAALGQNMCKAAPVVFIWSAIPRRTMAKYGSRGMRYIFMDVGHICQNLLLAASALALGACAIGAFIDDEVNDLLDLDGVEESVIYMASVGYPE